MRITATPLVDKPVIVFNIEDLNLRPNESLGFFAVKDWTLYPDERIPLHSYRYQKTFVNGKLSQQVDVTGKLNPNEVYFAIVQVQSANQTQDIGDPSNPEAVVVDAPAP